MKKEALTVLLLFAIALAAVAVPIVFMRSTGTAANSFATDTTFTAGNIPVKDSFPIAKSIHHNDSISLTDSTLTNDSIPTSTQLSSSLSPTEPDTLQMDSLQRAIYRHNKAIDDSLALDSLNRKRKNGIDAPVTYIANDSLTYDASTGLAFLYGDSHVTYEDMDLKSEEIYMCLDSSLVHAMGSVDCRGKK